MKTRRVLPAVLGAPEWSGLNLQETPADRQKDPDSGRCVCHVHATERLSGFELDQGVLIIV